MIDWVTALVPCAHGVRITGGEVISIRADGSVEWSCQKRLAVPGSFESSITVRSNPRADPGTELEISGNLVKWLQGHNLWGSVDLPALLVATLERLVSCPELGLTPTAADRARWLVGGYSITRVDVALMFELSTRSDVLAWLRAAEQTAHLSHRGRGQLTKGSTLYFGKHSRRWSLKLYSKGQEIDDNRKHQPAILDLPRAQAWADNKLRSELVLRTMELKRLGLGVGSRWLPLEGVPFDPLTLLRDRLGAMTMTTTRALSADVLESLRPALRTAVLAWESGADLRAMLSRRTFYRYRAELLPHGIDLVTVLPSDASNVVPLVRILEAVPASVPDWAVGTPLYFEPRRCVGVK